jgi:hypothetical protein
MVAGEVDVRKVEVGVGVLMLAAIILCSTWMIHPTQRDEVRLYEGSPDAISLDPQP